MTIERNNSDDFIGREDILSFFRESILKSDKPTYHILSLYGEAGVGKTTLLNRLKSIADAPEFNRYSLTGLVDGSQGVLNSIGVMEQFANQFKAAKRPLDAFEQEFESYEEEEHRIAAKPTKNETILHDVEHVADAAAGMLPLAGPPGQLAKSAAETSVDLAGTFFEKKMEEHRRLQEANRLFDQVDDLTRAFVDDLDRLAENKRFFENIWMKRKRLVMLFIDAFDRLADDLGPWLINHFLKTIVDEKRTYASDQVVVVVASRFPIQKTTKTTELESWLAYSQIIQSFHLTRFTRDETKLYLTKKFSDAKATIDDAAIEVFWQKSHGLPFYLSLVQPDPQGNVDPTEDIVNVYLNSISAAEKDKRHFALVAALMSRPIIQDDLSAFPFLTQDAASLYEWLIAQSFVNRIADGRYSYLDMAQEVFRHYLYRTSQDEYYEGRRNLAAYYRDELAKTEQEKGVDAYNTTEWQELLLALVTQLFFLPNAERYIEAVRCIINAYVHVKQPRAVANMLIGLSGTQFDDPFSPSPQIVSHLLTAISADIASQQFIDAHTYLLHMLDGVPEALFPKALRSHIYYQRSQAYFALHQYWLAIADLNRSIELNPNDEQARVQRGLVHLWLKDLDAARADYAASLELAPANSYNGWMIEWVVMCQNSGQAGSTADSNNATAGANDKAAIASRLEKIAASDTGQSSATACQGVALLLRQQHDLALTALEQALVQQQTQSQNSNAWSLLFWKGMTTIYLNCIDEALDALEQSLVLGLPPVLLFPLHWLQQDNPDFYEHYAKPILARYP